MPSGIYDRSKSKPNNGMFKSGKKSPKWLIRKRVNGWRKTLKKNNFMDSRTWDREK